MSACILHAGIMKTGTSSIQKSLIGFADAKNVWYEDRKGRTNHGRAVLGIVGASNPSKETGAPELDARERFDETIRSLDGRRLIVSAEAIPLLSSTRLRELGPYFKSRGLDDLSIIAYVRPPVG